MIKVKRATSRLLVVILMLSMCLTLTGCDIDIPSSAKLSIDSAFNQRVEDNLGIISNLYNDGLLSAAEKEQMEISIRTTADTALESMRSITSSGDIDDNNAKLFASSVVGWRCHETSEKGIDDDDFIVDYFTNAVVHAAGGETKNVFPLFKAGAEIKPIILVPESAASVLNEKLRYPIYVLSPNVSSMSDLMQVLERVKTMMRETEASMTAGRNDASYSSVTSALSSYFVPLLDEDGNNVTLLSATNVENKLVQDSTGSPYVRYDEGSGKHYSYGTALHDSSDYSDGSLASSFGYSFTKNEPGKDLIIAQYNEEVMAVRLSELNMDAYRKISGVLGTGNGKYLVVPAETGGRIYYMQYQVGYISEIAVDEDDDSRFEYKIDRSQLELNLWSDTTYKRSGTGDVAQIKSVSEIDPYLNIKGGDSDSSSYVIFGKTGLTTDDSWDELGEPWDLKFGEADVLCSVPRIVLADYLELSYSPSVVPEEILVAYGRKLRITSWDDRLLSEPIGCFVDLSGTTPPISERHTVMASDLADAYAVITEGGPSGETYVAPANILHLPESSSQQTVEITEAWKQEMYEFSLTEDYDNSKVDMLPQTAVDKIKCTFPFPCLFIAKNDSTGFIESSKPKFYGMLTRQNFQTSGLMSWIVSTDSTSSLTWWNDWLENHQYNYRIGADSLTEFLQKNYVYELNQSGIITLNLDTISKIQEEYTADAKQDRNDFIRTMFKIVGYIMVGYSVIMMLCWVGDTTVDMGLGLLEKVTFHRLVAVSDDIQIPADSKDPQSHTSYVGFQGILVASLKIMAVGLLFVLLDVVSLIVTLITAFGKFAEAITNLILGGK